METASTWTLRQLMSDPYRKTANLLLRKSIEAVSQYLISKTIKFPYKKILHKTAWCAISSHEKLWKIPPLVDSNTILILSSQSQLRLQDDNCVLAPYTVVHFGDSGHLYFWQTRQKIQGWPWSPGLIIHWNSSWNSNNIPFNNFNLILQGWCSCHQDTRISSHMAVCQEWSSLLHSGMQNFDYSLIIQIYKRGFLKQWKQSNQVSDHTCVLVIYCCKISLSRV